MKYFSILESPSEKFVKMTISKMGLNPDKYAGKTHPQEDFICVSKKYPIFVVADGVTLIQNLIDQKEYPDPSPAGEIAQIFCENSLKVAEEKYESSTEFDLKEIFKTGNEAVRKYNQKYGRTKETVDYWDNDFYAATAAFVIIKNNKVYWASICDSYVINFDNEGNKLFESPECKSMIQAEGPKFAGDPRNKKEKIKYTWSTLRNGVNNNNERIGYGVITGEPEALLYMASGSFDVKSGDFITILTDGFEEYIKLPEFISILTKWPDNLEYKIKDFSVNKINDDPEKFGHERTLAVIYI